jgi:hypothetical protein
MKIKHVLTAILLFSSFSFAFGQTGHAITVHLKGYHQGMLYLGNFYGKQTYVVD